MKTRPNVLFLFDGEHREDVFGFAGNGVVRTPFLDGLAGRAWDNEMISQLWGKHLMIKRDHLKYQFYEDKVLCLDDIALVL